MPPLAHSIPEPQGNLDFPRRLRLTHAREYQAVYSAKVRKSSGLLLIYGMPNGRAEHRLGLAIHRRVGNAVARNRIKRLLREAFRLDRHSYPLLSVPVEGNKLGCDLIIQVKIHEPGELTDYRAWVVAGVQAVVKELTRRAHRKADGCPPDAGAAP